MDETEIAPGTRNQGGKAANDHGAERAGRPAGQARVAEARFAHWEEGYSLERDQVRRTPSWPRI